MILIGLGANLPSDYGTPAETLEAAKSAMISSGIEIKQSSRTYLSAPVPVSDAPWYANAVALIETELSPHELLKLLNKIEADFGRIRTYRNAPRVLDLDILAFNDEIIGDDGADLCLPHPRMYNRAFVLKPLNEIASNWQHPVLRQSASQLIAIGKQEQSEIFEQTVPLNPGEEYRVAG